MYRKVFCLVLAFAVVLSVAACGAAQKKQPAQTAAEKAQTAVEPTQVEASKEVTLKLWSQWASDADGMKKPLDKVLADWQAANPNIKIEMDAINTDAYKAKVKVASAANELPDIFFSWGGGFAKPFADANLVLQLDQYLNDGTKDKLVSQTLNNFTYDGKTYGLPMYMWLGVLYCNQDIFRQNGVTLPDTYNDLLTAVKTFTAKGITPFAVGEKELWPGMFFQNALAMRTVGIDGCVKALSKQASFDTPEFKDSAAKLDELVRAGAFSKGCMGVDELEAEASFAQGKAAMIYMGDWAAATFEKNDSPVRGKVAVKNFPALDGARDNGSFLGGAIDTFMVSTETRYKDESVQALKYICENLGKEGYLAGAAMPAWKVQVDASQINPLTSQITQLSQTSSGFMLAWDTFLEGADADTELNAVAKIFGGKSTPEEFVKELQTIRQ